MIKPFSQTTAASRRRVEIFASDAVRQLLERNGLADLEAVFEQSAGAESRHRGRAVCSLPLTEEDGRETRVFVKLYWGRRRVWPRLSELRAGQWFDSLPVREWHGLCRLRELGLNAAEPLAVYEDGWRRIRAAVIVRAVPPPESIFDMLQNGGWNRLAAAQQESLLEAVVSNLAVIHAAGLGWRGICTRHFFPEPDGGGRWKLWLIDCEGVHAGATTRQFARDYRKLLRSMRLSGADQQTLARLENAADRAVTSASAHTARRSTPP